jgi:DNA repair photolyase
MAITANIIHVKDYVSKSNLPVCDYVINPYVGCPHGCKYCYATFMKRFSGHREEWGKFIDIKQCDQPLRARRLSGKKVLMSSVTDAYNPFEKKYQVTRQILTQLQPLDCSLGITTKSRLVLRDLDLLKQCRAVEVSISINTLDEGFKNDMDSASSIRARLQTLKTLHEQGIRAILFISPIFPGITDVPAIIEASRAYIDEYWLENLNLRGDYQPKILAYIAQKYPHLVGLYDEIYRRKNTDYWWHLSNELEDYCTRSGVKYVNYFYHEKLVAAKKQAEAERRRAPAGAVRNRHTQELL